MRGSAHKFAQKKGGAGIIASTPVRYVCTMTGRVIRGMRGARRDAGRAGTRGGARRDAGRGGTRDARRDAQGRGGTRRGASPTTTTTTGGCGGAYGGTSITH